MVTGLYYLLLKINSCKCKIVSCSILFIYVWFIPVHSVITANISKYHLQFYYKKCEYNQHFDQNGESKILFFLPTVFEGCICQPIFLPANLWLRAERQWTQHGNFGGEFVLSSAALSWDISSQLLITESNNMLEGEM